MPVTAPRMTASTGPTRCCSAVAAPVTQKSDRPAASKTMIERPKRPTVADGEEGDEARPGGDREVAPVAEGRGRDADQQVARDPAGEADRDREHDDAEEVEPGAHCGEPAAEPEHERARQVEHEQERRDRSRAAARG